MWTLLVQPPVIPSPYHCAKENVEVDEQEETGNVSVLQQVVVLLQKRYMFPEQIWQIRIPHQTAED